MSPGTVYDAAGNAKVCPANQTVKHDWTAPSCGVGGYIQPTEQTPKPWTNHPVSLTTTCSDGVSGCTTSNQLSKIIKSENIADDNYEIGTYEDNAGNIAECTAPVYTDYTAPSCTITATTSDGAVYNGNWVDADVTLTGNCEDEGGSGCTGNVSKKYFKGNNNNGYYNSYSYNNSNNSTSGDYSPGTVSDYAGNSTKCDATTVRIDSSTPRITVKMRKGTAENFALDSDDDIGNYKNNSWAKYVYTIADADCGTSGCKTITYTTTGKTRNDTNTVGSTRHINAEGTSYITYHVCNNAGNCVDSATKTIRLDHTAPKCTTQAKIGNNEYTFETWTNKNVNLLGYCSDNLSGCTKDHIGKPITRESSKPETPGTVYDKAGNSTECDPKPVKIDKTAPEIKTSTDVINAKKIPNNYNKNQCNNDECILLYVGEVDEPNTVNDKYRGVNLQVNNDTGNKSDHSGIDTWGSSNTI